MKYITLKELSEKLGNRSRSSIYLDIQAGRLPKPVKLGGRNLFIVDEVDARLSALREAA